MVVHHPSQWPMIDEYGIDIHPGMYTAAAISEVKVSKYILSYKRNKKSLCAKLFKHSL